MCLQGLLKSFKGSCLIVGPILVKFLSLTTILNKWICWRSHQRDRYATPAFTCVLIWFANCLQTTESLDRQGLKIPRKLIYKSSIFNLQSILRGLQTVCKLQQALTGKDWRSRENFPINLQSSIFNPYYVVCKLFANVCKSLTNARLDWVSITAF
jgi:hypothetical protein